MFGEVFTCQFPLTSGAVGKLRHALVLFDLEQDAIVCRVTSVHRAGPLDVTLKDCRLRDWLKPSIARLDRLVTAEKSIFLRRLGVLSAADLDAVRGAWNIGWPGCAAAGGDRAL
ncbi:MAG: type II toxin-antitoxin system PemK/MazF family toxin [Acidobacteriales bacterium]|nr:type II toxin-antitoxin system PemK/MazF family toxin [Terriglobales bacterium]